MNDKFTERQQGFEKKFARDEELQFKVQARSNKYIAEFVLKKLGKNNEELQKYTQEIIKADMEEAGSEDVFKKVNVLSGGEKVRCMLSRMMLIKGNLLFFDNPTDHLDLESIQALNDGLVNFKGTVLFTSHDYLFTDTISNRIIEIGPDFCYDKLMTYQEFVDFKKNKV